MLEYDAESWSAKGPLKVRLETGESAVLDQRQSRVASSWTWSVQRGSEPVKVRLTVGSSGLDLDVSRGGVGAKKANA
jgi:hypothetical protein